jgi:hypothetical protein
MGVGVMKQSLWLGGLIVLGACGMSQSRFLDKYNEQVCSVCESTAEETGSGGFQCADLEAFFFADDEFEACDYDPAAAADCLRGEWVCNTEYAPVLWPERPAVCDDVWICGSATSVDSSSESSSQSGSTTTT